jgi:hypothetical protein
MIAWILVSLILAVMVVFLIFMMNKKTNEVTLARKAEEREWTLKVALEKTFNLPTVEAKELATIETQIDAIMNSQGEDAEVEEKMRLAIMELYAQKAEKWGPKAEGAKTQRAQ